MGKFRQRPTVSRKVPSAIVVDQPRDLHQHCLRTIRDRIGIRDLAFEEIVVPHNEILATLRGNGSVSGPGRERLLLPLQNVVSAMFWLGASLKFAPQLTKYCLKSVSLQVFVGDWSAEKRALLRAEWDNPDPTPSNTHAQPHWHVYPPPAVDSAPESLILEPKGLASDDQQDLSRTTMVHANRFHFAMASTWQDGIPGQHQFKLYNREMLTNWLDGCILYILDQLRYLG